jgi:hypothetical protein
LRWRKARKVGGRRLAPCRSKATVGVELVSGWEVAVNEGRFIFLGLDFDQF